jgi:hypothetical protein
VEKIKYKLYKGEKTDPYYDKNKCNNFMSSVWCAESMYHARESRLVGVISVTEYVYSMLGKFYNNSPEETFKAVHDFYKSLK